MATGSSAGPGQAETVSHKNSSGGTLKVYLRVVGDTGEYKLDTTSG